MSDSTKRQQAAKLVFAMAIEGGLLLDRLRRSGDLLPVVLCIDVEPDPRTWGPSVRPPWRGFEQCLENISSLRDRLSRHTDAPATFNWCLRMDPQIADTWGSPAWVAETYGDELAELVGHGDQLGLHTHLWRKDGDDWTADFHDEAWAEHCLSVGLDAFEAAFGRPCEAHRSGDHFLSPAMLARLEASDVKVDLTIEPGSPPTELDSEQSKGLLPDYREVPIHPFRATAASFPMPDPSGEGLLMIPQLSFPTQDHRLPLFPRGEYFTRRLAREMFPSPPPVVAMAMRSTWATEEAVLANLEHLSRYRGVRFMTAGEIAEQLGSAASVTAERLSSN